MTLISLKDLHREAEALFSIFLHGRYLESSFYIAVNPPSLSLGLLTIDSQEIFNCAYICLYCWPSLAVVELVLDHSSP